MGCWSSEGATKLEFALCTLLSSIQYTLAIGTRKGITDDKYQECLPTIDNLCVFVPYECLTLLCTVLCVQEKAVSYFRTTYPHYCQSIYSAVIILSTKVPICLEQMPSAPTKTTS